MKEDKKLKILMLEDSQDDVFIIERVLRKGGISFQRQCVDTREEFTDALHSFKPDVILSDHGLPQFNSREAYKICIEAGHSVPFILVTGTVSEEFAISSLRDGADDYILKANLTRLPTAIRNALKRRRLEKLKRGARHALRKQNNELEKVNRELDRFVYSVSHNLKGPLASMRGVLNVARIEKDEKNIDLLLTMMSGALTRMDETVKEIIDYSKNSRKEVLSVEIGWSSIIDEAFMKLDYLKSETSVSLKKDIRATFPFFSDEDRIQILLTNLLSNAINYKSGAEDPFVKVSIATNEDFATINIEDNGIGIKSSFLPKVYDMFFRGNERSQGAGLGLYIVHEVITKMHGTVNIESQEGRGTCVKIVLPNMRTCEMKTW